MSKFKLDGVVVSLVPPDLDGDGVTGGTELVQRPNYASMMGVQQINQPAETREAMREMNSDIIEPDTRMSTIDMKTRLSPMEMTHVLAFDTLVALKVIPTKALMLTRQKKRLNVSLNGKGREEAVDIALGEKRSIDEKKGGGWLKSFMGGGDSK